MKKSSNDDFFDLLKNFFTFIHRFGTSTNHRYWDALFGEGFYKPVIGKLKRGSDHSDKKSNAHLHIEGVINKYDKIPMRFREIYDFLRHKFEKIDRGTRA